MSDKELVKRLLDFDRVTVGDARDAALRIEALTNLNEALVDREAETTVRYDAKLGALEAKLAAAVDWFETIRDRAKGDYMAHTYYLDALAALATIEKSNAP
jgi:hypothetical protein